MRSCNPSLKKCIASKLLKVLLQDQKVLSQLATLRLMLSKLTAKQLTLTSKSSMKTRNNLIQEVRMNDWLMRTFF